METGVKRCLFTVHHISFIIEFAGNASGSSQQIIFNLGEYILEGSSVDRVLCFHFLQRLNLKKPQQCHLQDMSSYNDTG